MPIKILPEETINKIAAGEVVERPANAVKELIENSLDAKSTSIEVEIKGAGRRLIRVRDNGTGIPAGEIKLAVTRHATSKLSAFGDLEKLYSMGFRGEALPSIAAVSNLIIQSHPLNTPSGWELSLKGGKKIKEGSWAGSAGTNIEVSDLFFNTPAREKFLKSDATERSKALKIIEELSLAWPGVSFKVISEGKAVLETPKTSNRIERIMDVLGKDFASTLIHAEVSHPFLKINAYITKRENSLASRNYQFLFVNNRPVNFGRSIMHSLYEAYRENLPAGRHPGAVIFLEINPSEIDVNIHPTKREVRFSKEQQVHHLIYSSIKNALSSSPSAGFNLKDESARAGQDRSGGEYRYNPQDKTAFSNEVKEPSPRFSYSEALAVSGIFDPPEKNRPTQSRFEYDSAPEAGRRIIGQLFNLYIIAQDGEGLTIIDQHAAAERIRYEKYLGQWRSKRVTLQPLLFSENIELPPSLRDVAASNADIIKEAGWEIEEFGENTVRVTAVPAVLGSNISAGNMLKEIFESLLQETKLPKPEKIEKIIRAACRSSIKAGDTISAGEALNLIEELYACESPNTCPHGRPTILKISRQELEKHFSRK